MFETLVILLCVVITMAGCTLMVRLTWIYLIAKEWEMLAFQLFLDSIFSLGLLMFWRYLILPMILASGN